MSENAKPLYILLPICMETKHDVFFNIVKTIIARSKVEEHYLDNALKFGLTGDKFRIESEDITGNWAELVSKEQQIRQSKILGYWAIEHFPTLGKKMHGQSWKPPTRECFRIDENSTEIVLSETDIDAIVFKKLKLRLLEVNLSKSTLAMLKHFIVDPPIDVGKYNECQISPKIKSFDVGDSYWQALKLGKFATDFEERVDVNPTEYQPESLPQRETEEQSQVGSQLVATRKRAHHDTVEADETNGKTVGNSTGGISLGSKSASAHKRANLGTLTSVNNGRALKIHNGEASIDTIHAAIVDLRKEIFGLNSSVLADRQSWQMMIINPKDEEIASLNSTIQKLRQTNENLMADQLTLKDQVQKQTSIINALQQGIEATSKLHEQCERDATKKDVELETIKNAHKQLHDELNQLNISTASMVEEWKMHIEKLETDLSTAEKLNSEADDIMSELQNELNVSQAQFASKDNQLKDALSTLNELRAQIERLSPDKSDIQTQTDVSIESYNELRSFKIMLAVKDQELESIENLQLSSSSNTQTQKIPFDVATAEKVSSQTIDRNANLQEIEHDQLKVQNGWHVPFDLSSPPKIDIQMETDTCNQMKQEQNVEPGHTSISIEGVATMHVNREPVPEFETDDPIVRACRIH